MLDTANILGYKGDEPTCGLHIHIDKRAFNSPISGKNSHNIGKLIYLFEKYWSNFVSLSRRDEDRLRRYAHKYEYKYRVIEGLQFDEVLEYNTDCLVRQSRDDKYFSINLKHDATVEIRVFKGTSKFESIIGLVQLCDRLVDICVDTKLDDIRKLSFFEIIEPLLSKPEFKQYIENIITKGYFNYDEGLKQEIENRLKGE